MTILVRGCDYLVRNTAQVERDCDLLIEGNRIQLVGKNLQAPPGSEILDARHCLVMPGLINAHTHLYQNFLKGSSPGVPLVPWCNQVLFPNLDLLRAGMKKYGARPAFLWSALAACEMIHAGITSCVDMDAVSPGILQGWQATGFRGVLAYTLANKWVPEELRASENVMKEQLLEFVAEHHRPNGLTTVFAAPSALFLCTDDFLVWAGEQARRHDLGMQIHISEIASEVDDMLAETGHTPLEHLEHLGLLDSFFSAVHCVHLRGRDIEILPKWKCTAVHCPKSNMKLADGAAPVNKMKAAGIPIALGTDGCASNDLLDMWEEMRQAVLLARVSTGSADALTPADAFQMATAQAARAARLEAGELLPGRLADLVILDLQSAHLQPFNELDPINMLVFCARAGDVRDTIINGKIVMRNRQLTLVNEVDLLQESITLKAEFAGM